MLWIIYLSILLTPQSSEFKNFRWLEGKWQNTKTTNAFEEWWWNEEKQHMEGRGYRIQLRDTLVFEKLSIKMYKGAMHYIPIIEEDGSQVPYKISKQSSAEFVCDNTKYDFPKSITYVNKAGKFETIVVGNGKKQVFTYKKLK